MVVSLAYGLPQKDGRYVVEALEAIDDFEDKPYVPETPNPLPTTVRDSLPFGRGKLARVLLVPAKNTGKGPVYGDLELEETEFGVYINGKIFGLETGKHGFHVHAVGDLGNDCKAAGGHFNPQMV